MEQQSHNMVVPATRRANLARDMSHIEGWGADLDEKNRPAYPMERTPPRLDNVHWEEPEQQPIRMEVFCSPERPRMTPVFGTGAAPRGLSGAMRAAAYQMTESDLRHWFLLMFADRVDMVEGIGDDIMKGKLPNILGEMGIKSEFRHNPKGLAKKAVVGAAVIGLAVYLLKRRK
jgi:hypothetical protein